MSDQLSDNVETVDAAGNVGANFAGHVKALGLDLDAADSLNSSLQQKDVRWLSAGGAMIGEIVAAGSATPPANGQRALTARAFALDLTETSIADLSAMGPAEHVGDPTTVARVVAIDSPGLASAKRRVQADVTTDVGGALVQRTIIAQSDGASDFLQLVATARRSVAFGQISGGSALTWAGGVSTSSVTVVAHGLGRFPVAVFATFNDSVGVELGYAVVVPYAWTGTQFNLSARTTDGSFPAAGSFANVSWLAIG